jgi:hypothetical protein
MKRIVMVVAVIALMPLLMGAGGGNPGIPSGTKIAGPTFTASVVMDPHEEGSETTTHKQASIRIYSAGNTAAAMFHIPADGFPLNHGCDLSFTDQRFRYVTLISWIPEDVLNALFNDLGTGRDTSFEPIITKIVNDACTPDPANLNPVDSLPPIHSLPGILSFQATIRFQVPQ